MELLKSLNRGIRFLLELAALGAFAYFGYTRTETAWRWLLAVVLAAIFALVWGMFVAPRARVHFPRPLQHTLGTVILLLAAAAAFAATANLTLAIDMAAIVIVNTALILLWSDEPPAPRSVL